MTTETTNIWWGNEIKIDKSQEINNLGWVIRNGKKHIRRYNRSIKNGFSILHLLDLRIRDAEAIMLKHIKETLQW